MSVISLNKYMVGEMIYEFFDEWIHDVKELAEDYFCFSFEHIEDALEDEAFWHRLYKNGYSPEEAITEGLM